MEPRKIVALGIRWLLVVPIALCAAWLGWLVVWFGNAMSTARFDEDGGLMRFLGEVGGSAVMGGAFVYVGARIAPDHRREVAYLLTATTLVICGFLAFPAWSRGNIVGLLGLIAMAAAACTIGYRVAEGVITLESRQAPPNKSFERTREG